MSVQSKIVAALLGVFVALQVPLSLIERRLNGSEGVYWQTMRHLEAGRKLYSEIFYSQLPLFIETARLGRVLPVLDLYGGRLMMLLFAPLALLCTFLIVRRLVSPAAGALAVLLLAVDPLFFNLSHQLTGEIPALALTLLGAWIILNLSTAGARRARWLTLAAGAVLGVAVQLKALMILPIVVMAGLWMLWNAKPVIRRWQEPALILSICALINLICLAWFGWFSGGGPAQLQGGMASHFAEQGGLHLGANLKSVYKAKDYSAGFLQIVAPWFALSIFLMWGTRLDELARKLLIVSLSLFALLFFYIRLNTDHLVLFSPLGAAAVAAMFTLRPRPDRMLHYIPIVYCVFVSAVITIREDSWYPQPANNGYERSKRKIEAEIPPDGFLLGNHPFLITAANRMMPPEFADFSAARAASRSLTCATIENRIQKGDIQGFVLTRKGLEDLECGDDDLKALVLRHFPKVIHEDSRTSVFVR